MEDFDQLGSELNVFVVLPLQADSIGDHSRSMDSGIYDHSFDLYQIIAHINGH